MQIQSDPQYDALAWFYNRHWAHELPTLTITVLERLLLSYLPAGARILDLGCGTGHVTHLLAQRGYAMTGIDASAGMLQYARENVPSAEFILADARDLALPRTFDAVIATGDCINHILNLEDLHRVFQNVYAVLKDGGTFLFDVNTEEAYRSLWHKAAAVVQQDNVCFIQGAYDTRQRLGHTELIMFRQQNGWQRADAKLFQRFHPSSQVRAALRETGFARIASPNARRDLGLSSHLALGRVYFRARREPLC